MRLSILFVGACLLDLGFCRPVTRAKDPFFTKPRAAGTYFYNVDLMVDTPTHCSEFHDSLVTKVAFRTALSATLNEIAEKAGRPGFIVDGAAICRDSTSGDGHIHLILVVAETQPGTDVEFAGQVFQTFMHSGGQDTFLLKLRNRLANMEGTLDEFGTAVLATYPGEQVSVGLNTEPPHHHPFDAETDLEILPCKPDWDATCPSLCYCRSGKCAAGKCILSNPGECMSDSDCTDPLTCGKNKCDTQTGKCVYAPATTPCTNPFLYGKESVCSGTGFCRVCTTAADCAGNQMDAACFTCDLNLDECLPANDGHICRGVSVYGTITGMCASGKCLTDCGVGSLPCLLSNGEVQCSTTVVTLCADTWCATHLDLCPGYFASLPYLSWGYTAVNVKVQAASTFSLYLYGNTGYSSLVTAVASYPGNYNYYTANNNKYLNKDILSLKLITP